MIRFVVEQDGLGFIAVKALAHEAGLELPETPTARAQGVAAAGLHGVMAAAVTHYTALLRGNGVGLPRAYRDQRGTSAARRSTMSASVSHPIRCSKPRRTRSSSAGGLSGRCDDVRVSGGAHPSLRAETVSAQIIEALTRAPDLDRLDLAVGLQKVGFHDTARAILAKCWSTSLPS